MYHRFLEDLCCQFLDEFRILYITGPRQAGKTTLVRALAQKRDITYITLDNQAILQTALHDPRGLISSFSQDGKKLYALPIGLLL